MDEKIDRWAGAYGSPKHFQHALYNVVDIMSGLTKVLGKKVPLCPVWESSLAKDKTYCMRLAKGGEVFSLCFL